MDRETTLHVLRDCTFAREVWRGIMGQDVDQNFFNSQLTIWLKSNLDTSAPNWIHEFALTLDSLWKNRNNFTFCQIVTNPLQVVCEIKGRMHVLSSTTFCKPRTLYEKDNPKSHIRWTPPPSNSLKLNCDGAVADNVRASCGGILRDNNGDFILAFSGLIGNCSVLQVEIMGHLIKDKFLSYHIIIESDSVLATEFLNKGCPRFHPCYSLINQIVRMAGGFYEVECVHIFREANQVADKFAKLGLSFIEGFQCFNTPPNWAHFLLLADKFAFCFPRGF
uniref:Ribonuclease H protein At1g65750 n=1 Tax=Cajanus cajan TaxID=3821 RepID=A0A151UCR5_CAJCA|nr:Putative ribonuclease H protein At1g65750 [Cajanus cajan]